MTQHHSHRFIHCYRRAVLALGIAAIVHFASHADAQSFGDNLFSGPDIVGSDSISTTNATLSVGQSNSGLIGPGYTAAVALGVGARDTLTESINAGNFGTLTAVETGPGLTVGGLPVGLGVGGTFSATKALPEFFVPNQRYSFRLSTTSSSALNLLSGTNVTFSTVDNGVSTVIYSLSGGSGLLGIAQVLNLFGSSNSATVAFTAPANVDTSVPITFTVSGGLTASALGSTFTFTDAMLSPVPEAGSASLLALGAAAYGLRRFYRRQRKTPLIF